MDKQTGTRAAAEAANQAAGGFFQGLGWGAATAAITLVALHPAIVAGAVVASGAALAAKRWRGQQLANPITQVPDQLSSVLARVRERVNRPSTKAL